MSIAASLIQIPFLNYAVKWSKAPRKSASPPIDLQADLLSQHILNPYERPMR